MITGEVNVRLQADGVLHLPRSGVNIEVEQDEDGLYVNHIVPGGIPAGGGGSITVDDALFDTSENPVQNKVIKSALDGKGTYSKPSGGIPKTDLDAAVQTSLGKADTALQAHQDISGKADQAIIAPAEAAMTATRNYTAGDLLIVGNALYKATANIANGGAITVGTNVSAAILSQQLSSGGSTVPEWQLLGEYDINQLKGDNETWTPNITFSDLGGLTDLYFRWENIQNTTTTGSSFGNITINGRTACANNLIPISKNGTASYGYTRAHWNGLTWEFVKSAGAVSGTNYGPGNASVLYNETFNVGACNTLQVAGPSATYRPKTGILKIYGGK